MGQLVERYVINADVLEQLLRQSQPQWMTYGATLTGDRQRMGALAAEVAAYRKSMAQALQTWLEQQGAAGCKGDWNGWAACRWLFCAAVRWRKANWSGCFCPYCSNGPCSSYRRKFRYRKSFLFSSFGRGLQGWLRKQPLPDLVSLCQAALHSDGSFQQMLSAQQNQALQRHIQSCAEGWLAQENHSTELADWLAGLLEEQRFKAMAGPTWRWAHSAKSVQPVPTGGTNLTVNAAGTTGSHYGSRTAGYFESAGADAANGLQHAGRR